MSANIGAVPFNYGDLFSITSGADGKVIFWFSGKDGAIRGLWIDPSEDQPRIAPGDREYVLKRGTGNETPMKTPTQRVHVGDILPPGPK